MLNFHWNKCWCVVSVAKCKLKLCLISSSTNNLKGREIKISWGKINKCATYYFKHKKIKKKHFVLYIECIYKMSFPLKLLTVNVLLLLDQCCTTFYCWWGTFINCFHLVFLKTASKARRSYQFSGKITVKAKEKSYSKLEIPYQAEVLDGWVKQQLYGLGEYFFILWKVWLWYFFLCFPFCQLLGLWPHGYTVPHQG